MTLNRGRVPNLLICEDDEIVVESLKALFHESFKLHIARNIEDSVKLIQAIRVDYSIIDLELGERGRDGSDIISKLNSVCPSAKIFIYTGNSTIEQVSKCFNNKIHSIIIKSPSGIQRLARDLLAEADLWQKHEHIIEGIFAGSASIRSLLNELNSICNFSIGQPSAPAVLFIGETGTGKELLANYLAKRTGKQIVSVNMSAIPNEMAESELFGHERGAFTGAVANKVGLLEAAHNGIFFLDEIGEMSPSTQAKLLRAVQFKEFFRLGSVQKRTLNTWFVSATHSDLRNANNFRPDLLQRLGTYIINVPPLRERIQDIGVLSNHFLNDINARQNSVRNESVIFKFTACAMQTLERYSWPGNIRELQNVVFRAATFAKTALIDGNVISEAILQGRSESNAASDLAPLLKIGNRVSVLTPNNLDEALQRNSNNRKLTAKYLGVSESTLFRLLRKRKARNGEVNVIENIRNS